MTKISEIRDQAEDQLEFRLTEIDREYFDLVNELKISHKLEKPHFLKSLKKEKAQILTILTERKRQSKA
ncbi:MAG: 50S ribosomal protein L29 [Candidatus Anoxychlamydiales bacterium]|nr:50S ribosomal protein L29 [Candidatus Anoxychlamydiales bacterium]NGX40900.1 50S ribosomal protein L29 [Candidatus Anoxychlamydiales bacterium]HEU64640.1 50S ribosomal protein L29 [Chlamydiota bacterium]